MGFGSVVPLREIQFRGRPTSEVHPVRGGHVSKFYDGLCIGEI